MQRLFLFALACALSSAVGAQSTSAVVGVLADKLEAQYVFPDKGTAMARQLRSAAAQNAYAGLANEALAARLTKELQDWSADKHLRVRYSADPQPNVPEVVMDIPAAEKPSYFDYLRHDNYGITKLEVLRGNIGLLAFNYLCTPEAAGDSYAAAMNYLASTDALILDLRQCRGSSSPDAVPFLLSYLFDQPTHINSLYWRKGNSTRQAWTAAVVPGKRYGRKPVYVLVSGATFSGAEEMAYDLQQLKRATVVGERTAGGAHPGGEVSLSPHFRVFMPSGRAVNPVSGTNWEGVGVQPDSAVAPQKALHRAQVMALDSLRRGVTDAGYRDHLTKTMNAVQAATPVLVPVTFTLDGHAGASQVFVAGSFNGWQRSTTALQRKGGRWTVTVEAEPGEVQYKFVVDGVWMTDPANPDTTSEGGATNSVRRVVRSH